MKRSICLLMAMGFLLLISGNVFAFSYLDKLCGHLNKTEELNWVQTFATSTSDMAYYWTKYEYDFDERTISIEGNDLFSITLDEGSTTSGTVAFKDSAYANQVWWMVVKADGGQKIYKYDPNDPGDTPWSWDTTGICGSTEGFDVSHISFYTTAPVPIPAAAWLLGSGLLGLVGVQRWRRRR